MSQWWPSLQMHTCLCVTRPQWVKWPQEKNCNHGMTDFVISQKSFFFQGSAWIWQTCVSLLAGVCQKWKRWCDCWTTSKSSSKFDADSVNTKVLKRRFLNSNVQLHVSKRSDPDKNQTHRYDWFCISLMCLLTFLLLLNLTRYQQLFSVMSPGQKCSESLTAKIF